MEFRTYFVYFNTFSDKFKVNELPQSLGRLLKKSDKNSEKAKKKTDMKADKIKWDKK